MLKRHYNSAWNQLWESENARKIYQFVHNLKDETKIEVGATDSDATPGVVRWNPYEKNVLLNKTQGEIGVGSGGLISPDDIVGQSSAAVTLIHELGHIRQHHNANAVVEKVKAKHEAIKTTKIPNLGELISLIDDQAQTVDRGIARGNSTLILENDNVTQHERPVANDLGEGRRNEYQTGMGNAAEYEEFFTAEAWKLVKACEFTVSWSVEGDGIDLGVEKSQTAIQHIEAQLSAMKVAAAKITGWKRPKAEAAIAIVEDILTELKLCDDEWQKMVEDEDLTKPVW